MLLSVAPVLLVASSAGQLMIKHDVQRADRSAITYWLESGSGKSDVILVMQGTGCEPVSAKPNLRHAAEILPPGARTLLIDKRGAVSSEGSGSVDGCSKEYWNDHTLSGRVLDCLQVIADLRRQPWWNGRITIFGGSEGGAVAALLAPLVPETTAVVVLSSGTGVPVGDLIRAALPPEMAAEAPAVFAAARERPTGDLRWAGLSYRWWADAVDMVPARQLALSRAPILLIHGGRDRSSPVATARAGYEVLRAANAKVTYREFPEFDHFMRSSDGREHVDDVLGEASRWIHSNANPEPRR